jgi:hypothetical protein
MSAACPVPGCTRQRQGEMCKRHWFQVPPNMRRNVWSTWRQVQKVDSREAWTLYTGASRAALEYVSSLAQQQAPLLPERA